MSHPFDSGTAIRSLRTGALPFRAASSGARGWETVIDERWWQPEGPNGGYLAALLLRGMSHVVSGGMGLIRSLTIQRVTPGGAPGGARLYAVNERADQPTTTVTASLEQADRPIAVAVAAFAAPGEGPDYGAGQMPELGDGPQDGPAAGAPLPFAITPLSLREPTEPGRCAAWMTFAADERRSLDPLALSALATAWTPTPRVMPGVRAAETVVLTIDFNAAATQSPSSPQQRCLGVFALQSLEGGLFREYGELWSDDGTLLARTRQIGMVAAA
ncbi:MAG TPA: acyl-CoA thioesterase domain-containing protein [Solirubrobacteraceae bacterium]|nr:acyl-CoA thioesterase domain-containing protein [Solirubrobacteraceae bacterium]